ncbi:phosphatidylglycerophosphatase A family protein [Desulfurispira natronophila]|uniref:Phosphatidylglycerophosphatase A n=1 Tax=Desulfurispira natronophila TaxID=682562 RepID=A0A7W7Y2F5_9BACT|nr:phosphatidylglycerophosphatase A [Desulfurispira natronophila]MBB5020848.1 phosphatidylglycerophosphatase A [Desulfurispira natronophila]
MKDNLINFIGTGLYSGNAPFAPGTIGTLPGIALLWLTAGLGMPWKMLIAFLLFAGGVWISNHAERLYGRKDPACVVIDEIAGVYFAGIWFVITWPVLLAIFILFRFFDIFKPFPVSTAEKLPAGWGVMMDDMAAGLYAALALWGGLALLNTIHL